MIIKVILKYYNMARWRHLVVLSRLEEKINIIYQILIFKTYY